MSYPVQIWDGVNYQGNTAGLTYKKYANMTGIGIADNAITSLKIAPFTQVTLYDGINYAAPSLVIYGPKEIPNLSIYTSNFNDRASSIAVIRLEPDINTKMTCCQSGTSGTCGEFVPGAAVCQTVSTAYCSERMWDPKCQSWCRANPAICDPMAIEYCKTYFNDPFCSCILSPVQTAGVINPKCVDKTCLTSGYLTTNMLSTACPNQITCEVKNYLTNTGVILSNTIPVQQNCGGGSSPQPSPPIVTNPVTTDDTTAITGLSSTWIFLIFIMFIFMTIATFFIIKKGKSRV